MEFIVDYIDFVLHIDRHLDGLIQTYGTWVYLILFAIIFVVTMINMQVSKKRVHY